MKLISQPPVVPGQASTATLLGVDQSGNPTTGNLEIPPGKDAELPANMATTDQLAEFVSGTFGVGTNDVPGVGLHLSGTDGSVQFITNSATNPVSKTIPTMDYLAARLKNGTGAIKYGIATGVQHGSVITFQQAFSSDNVTVFITVQDGGPNHLRLPEVVGMPNRNNFQISLNYWNGSGFVNEVSPITVFYLAVGEAN